MAEITFPYAPGFADVPGTSLAAEQYAQGVLLGRIVENAAMGMVRPEVFVTTQKHGDTVPLPVSPTDNYQYSRDELIYMWGITNTANPSTGSTSADNQLIWFAQWFVNQDTGEVTSEIWYSNDTGKKTNKTNDGTLTVYTIGSRRKTTMSLSAIPTFNDHADTDFAGDKALHETPLKDTNRNAKFSIVNSEAIYMGTYKSLDVVALPVSPVDGYVYSQDEVIWLWSWVWTTYGDSYVAPTYPGFLGIANLLTQLDRIDAHVDADGTVHTNVGYRNDSYIDTGDTMGRIAVTALCSRGAGHPSTSGMVTAHATASSSGGTGGHTSVSGITDSTGTITRTGSAPTAGDPSPWIQWTSFVLDSALPAGAVVTSIVPYATLTRHARLGYLKCMCGTRTLYNQSEIAGDLSGLTVSGASIGTSVSLLASATGRLENNSTVSANVASDPEVSTVDDIGFEVNYYTPGTPSSISFLGAVDFSWIDPALLGPGEPDRTDLMVQLLHNIRMAVVRPEFFDAGDFADGDTVPLPTSAIDSYTYTRDECVYLYEMGDTGVIPRPSPYTGNIRLVGWSFSVNQTTGVVSISELHKKDGGRNVTDNNGTLRVKIIAVRSASHVIPAPSTISDTGAGGSTGTSGSSGNVNNGGMDDFSGSGQDIADGWSEVSDATGTRSYAEETGLSPVGSSQGITVTSGAGNLGGVRNVRSEVCPGDRWVLVFRAKANTAITSGFKVRLRFWDADAANSVYALVENGALGTSVVNQLIGVQIPASGDSTLWTGLGTVSLSGSLTFDPAWVDLEFVVDSPSATVTISVDDVDWFLAVRDLQGRVIATDDYTDGQVPSWDDTSKTFKPAELPPIGGVSLRTTTSETVDLADLGKLIHFANAGAIAVTLNVASLPAFYYSWLMNDGAGTATITPSSGQIDSGSGLAANATLSAGTGGMLLFDGTNSYLMKGGGGGGGASSPLTTKGDLWGYSTTDARFPVGTNGQAIIVDSSQTLGLRYANRRNKIVSFINGMPAAGQIVFKFVADQALDFPANFASPNAYGVCGTNPASTATYNVYKVPAGGSPTLVGTVSISTSGVFTFATSGGSAFSLAASDELRCLAPAVQDTTLADVSLTLVATVPA